MARRRWAWRSRRRPREWRRSRQCVCCRAPVGSAQRRVDNRPFRQVLAIRVDDLQERRLLDRVDGFVHVADTGQLDDDLIVTARLNERLADAETVYAAFERLAGALQRVAVDRDSSNGLGLQDDLEAALQVETLLDGMRGAHSRDVVVGTGQGDPGRKQGQHDDECQRHPGARPQSAVPFLGSSDVGRPNVRPT